MKFKRLLTYLLAPMLIVSLLSACSDDDNGNGGITDPDPDPNLLELAQSDSDFSTLVGIIQDLGLESTLADADANLTVFAPTNSAFDAISGIIPSLSDDDLAEIVTYHLTEGAILSGQLQGSQDVTMLQGERTLVQASAAGVQINGFANVVAPDLEATNGVIHGIDQVLLPTEFRVAVQGPSLVEVAQDAGNFETIIDLAEMVGLTTTLQFLGPFTAFAPTDEAFDALFEEVDPSTLTGEQIAFILTYHVLFDEVLSTDLGPQQAVPTAAEELVYITADDDGVVVNGSSNVIQADITEPTNGVIHAVDQVLLPNAFLNIVQAAAKNFELTQLVGAASQFPDIVELLMSEGPYTVFAPNNDAFADISETVDGLSEEQVREVLTYHVIEGEILSSDLEASQTVTTLNGQDLEITVSDGTVTITAEGSTATVVTADVRTNNGVIHIIETVLIPEL